MKESLLHAHRVVKTANLVISRRPQAEYHKNPSQKPCCTCSTIIYALLTNDIIVLWRCRGRHCRRYRYRDYAYFWLWPESVFLELTKRKADSGHENETRLKQASTELILVLDSWLFNFISVASAAENPGWFSEHTWKNTLITCFVERMRSCNKL